MIVGRHECGAKFKSTDWSIDIFLRYIYSKFQSMEEFSSSEVCRRAIPGLPDSADKNKKGKKKGRDKKTVTLQSFLQQEGGEGGESGEADTMEQHFAKLNLDEEELIVMESCHRCSVAQECERFTTISL